MNSQSSRYRGAETTTLVVHVENKAGVLARVAGLFARRGFNIESLTVAPTDDERFSRLTIVVGVSSAPMEQVVKQLDKLVNVVEIQELNPIASIERELMMATVRAEPEIRGQILDLVRIFQATVLNVGHDEIMVSLTGSLSRIDDFEDLLRPYGIVDVQRTGKVALPKLTKNVSEQLA
ncbi:MAG: acetolactate synthase small subunit [Acidimicrobiia bacterium]|nr:acetolactate synthase small subunit [Acidimicrobiia bacterium]MYC58547.1 acetolactate synthase small subunit [Acidimicrobiia bacterium]MYG94305.1 acetolactate synthase small subunit [Acidimicrobiia bacterium]MYI30346.1 acetolactate synthase small subunit [Acidimicrobiia bacterium]